MARKTKEYTPPDFIRDVTRIPPADKSGKVRITKPRNKELWKKHSQAVIDMQVADPPPDSEEERAVLRWHELARNVISVETFTNSPIYSNPELLLAKALQYLELVETHPIPLEEVHVNAEGKTTRYKKYKRRVPTVEGLCTFLGIGRHLWYVTYKKHQAFREVIDKIETWIYAVKFEGATSGEFNANVIMRDLGLADRVKNELSGPDGGPIEHEVTDTSDNLKHLDISDWPMKEQKVFVNMLKKALALKKGVEKGQ